MHGSAMFVFHHERRRANSGDVYYYQLLRRSRVELRVNINKLVQASTRFRCEHHVFRRKNLIVSDYLCNFEAGIRQLMQKLD